MTDNEIMIPGDRKWKKNKSMGMFHKLNYFINGIYIKGGKTLKGVQLSWEKKMFALC